MTQFDTDAAVTAQSYEDCLKSSRRLFVAFLGDDVAATVLCARLCPLPTSNDRALIAQSPASKNLQEIEGRMSTGVEAYDRERESLMDALRKSQVRTHHQTGLLLTCSEPSVAAQSGSKTRSTEIGRAHV